MKIKYYSKKIMETTTENYENKAPPERIILNGFYSNQTKMLN